ncbi:MAG TPA: hypothetical protein VL443_29290 [Cyclobacteriaceae bacterium]|nr:hypothetical protein [Cyclobacteriaceae bacterium]
MSEQSGRKAKTKPYKPMKNEYSKVRSDQRKWQKQPQQTRVWSMASSPLNSINEAVPSLKTILKYE